MQRPVATGAPPGSECDDERCEHCPRRSYWSLYVIPFLRWTLGGSVENNASIVLGLGAWCADEVSS